MKRPRLPSLHHFRRNLELYTTGVDASFGMILYRWKQGKPSYLAIKHQQGHWGFPKGHAEGGEQPLETAIREVEEEVGISELKPEKEKTFEEKYEFKVWGRKVAKVVTFWLAEAQQADVQVQQTEIAEYKWITLEEGLELMTFEAAKKVLTEVDTYLKAK